MIGLQGFAQQKPQYTQYILNNFLLNPALAGIENYTDIKLGYRQQWTGVENAPKTIFATANFKLGDDYLWKNALSMPEKDDDPMSQNYMQNYTASPPHHGIGAILVSDKAGPIARIDANVTYAYHLKLSDRYNLSAGIGAGITNISFDLDQLKTEVAADPTFSNVVTNQFKPDLNAGLWFYGPRLFIGASVQQLIPQNLSLSSNYSGNGAKEKPHLFLTAGYKFFLAEDIDAYAAMIGFNIKKFINLTYAYDVTTSSLNVASNGTHELMLGIQLDKIYHVFDGGRW